MANKPDNVVYNEETETYDAFLKPYATSFSAPKIEVNDILSWKRQHANIANAQFSSEFEEIKQQYNLMLERYEYNQIIYNSKFTFEPIIGQIYHLYNRENSEYFLSLLAPNECDFNFVGSFKLTSDKIWEKQ